MKITIQGDGQPYNTKITDEDGRLLEQVTSLEYRLDANDRYCGTVNLSLVCVPVKLEGEVDELDLHIVVPRRLNLAMSGIEEAIKRYIADSVDCQARLSAAIGAN